MTDYREMARCAVERSRQEQGFPPRVTDRRALERVAALLNTATPGETGQGRNGCNPAGQAQPPHAPARRR